MNYIPKKKRGAYEKEFTLQHVLQNLQGYRLASGGIDPKSIEERLTKGEDLGEIYGQIITSKSIPAGTSSAEESTHIRKRRRKRKRRKIESSILSSIERDDMVTEKSKPLAESRSKKALAQSSLLVPYGDSSASSDGSEEACQRPTGPLPIPAAICDLYETGEKAKDKPVKLRKGKELDKRSATWDSDSDDTLAYFESVDSSSDDQESDGGERSSDQIAGAIGSEPSGKGSSVPVVTKTWSEKRAQWLFGPSQLSSYTCWKCNNIGHLAQDCTVTSTHTASASGTGGNKMGLSKPRIPQTVQQLLATCREIRKKKGQRCADCGIHSNLVACLDCGSVFCDGRGHVIVHLLQHPSHHKLFSFKLKRLLKCCKVTCEVVNVYELLVCSHCLSKAFSQHYSMVTAIWSRAGLVKVCNAISCEEHFQWHRMNCEAVGDEKFVEECTLRSRLKSDGMLSEFFF